MGAASLIILILAALAFSAGAIIVSRIFVKGTKNPKKDKLMNAVFRQRALPGNNSM